jgi:hypothetical protein
VRHPRSLAFTLALTLTLAMATAPPRARADDTLFAHPPGPAWISGQINVVTQGHPRARAAYSGAHSLKPAPELATSFVGTLFTGFLLTSLTEVIVDVELAGGGGISETVGLGGYTNLDVVRNPTLGQEPYLARLALHQVIPLGADWTPVPWAPVQTASRLPSRRLELWLGKLSTVDFFDRNAVGSDSHLQFLNWTVDNQGAYDYAADTRGYTYGLVIAYQSPALAVRLGEMLMPKVANGLDYDWDLLHARGESLELEPRWRIGERGGALRLLGFLNHARMGSYREAVDAAVAAGTAPIIEDHRRRGRAKAGLAINLEQELPGPLRLFARAGWNDGRNESFAYTEVDSSVSGGLDLDGRWWRRAGDRFGLAAVSNGLSGGHRRYLALGGQGFLLGDGMLRYGRETIGEAYYNAAIGRGLSLALDFQLIVHPGYNRDRGPFAVGGFRVHLEI